MAILGGIIKRSIELRHNFNIVWRSPERYQKRVLKKLLRKAAFTQFGEKYHFSDILRSKNLVNKFRAAVPVHDYNSLFSKWWHKCLKGESDVCWTGKVKYFALSSGTSDSASKHIPVTREMVKAIQKISLRQIVSLANFDIPKSIFEKGILMLGGSTHLQREGSYFEGDLSGITVSQLPFWFQRFYKPGRRISKEKDWSAKLDEITLKAKDWDIGVIVGVPAWVQLLMEKIIVHYNLKNIHEIWPNLTIYTHGGVSFEPYKKGFEELLGKPLIYIETYLASEGFIAFQDQPNSEMRLILDNGIFYEFIPFSGENFNSDGDLIKKPKTLLINEVIENEEYALLLSTCSGAWRYLIGDVIKIVNKERYEINIVGRTKHYLSLCGEHLSIDNMNKAIEMVSHDLDININEFVVSGIKFGSMFAHKWYIGTDDHVSETILRIKLDEKLKMLNDDYRVERISALKDVLVEVIPAGIFYKWLEQHGKVGAQNKFPRVMKKQQFEQWEKFVEKEQTVA